MNINYIYEDDTIEEKFYYDNFTGTYFLHDDKGGEPIEFTEQEAINQGILFDGFNEDACEEWSNME